MISGGRHIFPTYWKWFWCKFWEKKKMRQCKRDKKLPKGFCFSILAIQNVVAGENLTNGHELELGEEESGDQPWEPMSKECSGWREQCEALRWECSRLFKKLRPDQRGQSPVSKGKKWKLQQQSHHRGLRAWGRGGEGAGLVHSRGWKLAVGSEQKSDAIWILF